jgi:hypothetical protein
VPLSDLHFPIPFFCIVSPFFPRCKHPRTSTIRQHNSISYIYIYLSTFQIDPNGWWNWCFPVTISEHLLPELGTQVVPCAVEQGRHAGHRLLLFGQPKPTDVSRCRLWGLKADIGCLFPTPNQE